MQGRSGSYGTTSKQKVGEIRRRNVHFVSVLDGDCSVVAGITVDEDPSCAEFLGAFDLGKPSERGASGKKDGVP